MARQPAVIAAAVIAVAAPIDAGLLAGNRQVMLIERGQAGARTEQ